VDGKQARELNQVIRYTGWSVFRATTPLAADRAPVAAEVEELFEQLTAKDVVVRGTYDVSALRADADVLVWWHAPTTCRRRTGGSGARSWAGR
jgi:chlorite dismutase